MMPSTSMCARSLPVEDGVAGRGAVGAVGGQAGVVALIQGLLDERGTSAPVIIGDLSMSIRGSAGGAVPALVRWAGPPKVTTLEVSTTTRTWSLPCPAGAFQRWRWTPPLAVEAVDVARPAVAADGEQHAALVAGDDLGVVGHAVAVPVEEHDVAGFGLPAPPGRVVRRGRSRRRRGSRRSRSGHPGCIDGRGICARL